MTIVFAFSEYRLVLRGEGPLAALKSSVLMSRGHFWQIFTCVAAVLAPLMLLKELTFSAFPKDENLFLSLALDSLFSFLQLFLTVVVFRLFMLISESFDSK